MQKYAVEKTRLGIPLALSGGQMLGETTIPSGLACASSWDLDAIDACTRMRYAERITFARQAGIGHPTADLALEAHVYDIFRAYDVNTAHRKIRGIRQRYVFVGVDEDCTSRIIDIKELIH